MPCEGGGGGGYATNNGKEKQMRTKKTILSKEEGGMGWQYHVERWERGHHGNTRVVMIVFCDPVFHCPFGDRTVQQIWDAAGGDECVLGRQGWTMGDAMDGQYILGVGTWGIKSMLKHIAIANTIQPAHN